MITLTALLGFLVICLEFGNPGRKAAINKQEIISLNVEAKSRSNLKSLSYTQGQTISHNIYHSNKNYGRVITFNYSCNPLLKHFLTFCNTSTRYDTCWNLTPIWQEGLMDAISRILSLGGAGSLDIFHVILLMSYHLSFTLLEESGCKLCSSLHVDINFNADYEAAIVNSGREFKICTLHYLRAIFRRTNIDMHSLSVEKGSIRISFLLKNEAHNEDYYITDSFIPSFKVPNHMQVTMKKRLFQLQIHPVLKNRQRRLFHILNSLKQQMNVKYPSFSFYINKHILNELQRLSPDRMKKIVPYKKKGGVLTITKTTYDTEVGSDFSAKKEETTNTDFNPTEGRSEELPRKLDEIRSSKKGTEFESRRLLSVIKESSKLNHELRTRRSIQPATKDSNLRLKVGFSFQEPVKMTNNEEFQQHFKNQLAKRIRVPLPSIKDLKIVSGTDVSFYLSPFNDNNNAMDDQTVLEASDFLNREIREKKLRLTDLNGQLLMPASTSYVSMDDNSMDFSLAILILLGITLLMIIVLIIVIVYIAKHLSKIPKKSSSNRNRAYRNMDFGRDSSQSVGKYSYDSGLWIGPGSEPTFMVPDAPYYRPPTVEQITSTPRPITAVRTRLKTNWNVDERALSTIPDDLHRQYARREDNFH